MTKFFFLRPYIIDGVYCVCISTHEFVNNICFATLTKDQLTLGCHMYNCHKKHSLNDKLAFFHVAVKGANFCGVPVGTGRTTSSLHIETIARRASKRDRRYTKIIDLFYGNKEWATHCRDHTHLQCLKNSGFNYLIDRYNLKNQGGK